MKTKIISRTLTAAALSIFLMTPALFAMEEMKSDKGDMMMNEQMTPEEMNKKGDEMIAQGKMMKKKAAMMKKKNMMKEDKMMKENQMKEGMGETNKMDEMKGDMKK